MLFRSGARLRSLDGEPQHEGIVLGLNGTFAGNTGHHYFGLGDTVRDCSAVTAACLMVRRSVYEEAGGFDEAFKYDWNDVDFCLRLRQLGYRTIYTPHAVLYHHERATRGRSAQNSDPEDERYCRRRWGDFGALRDPFYNSNFDLFQPYRLKV